MQPKRKSPDFVCAYLYDKNHNKPLIPPENLLMHESLNR